MVIPPNGGWTPSNEEQKNCKNYRDPVLEEMESEYKDASATESAATLDGNSDVTIKERAHSLITENKETE